MSGRSEVNLKLELIRVRASERTVWLFVRLSTQGLSGLGEASDAFGFANTTKQDVLRMDVELRNFLPLIHGISPVDVRLFAQRAAQHANDLVTATAASAIEQALWDLAGQALGVPTWQLFGPKLRDSIPVYANINRATKRRTPEGFAEKARQAYGEGFRAFKAAPFDGFPRTTIDHGIACIEAIREAVGPEADVMADCHGFFDVPTSIDIARRLEPCNLRWFEEPVPPERTTDTLAIRRAIRQPMAGGELLFGVAGFEPLCRAGAVQTIMPDVKHCGGLFELTRIAAMANRHRINVAPHNPSGPVSTAASLQVAAVIPNFVSLEFQWGEVGWRSDLITPPERFRISNRPGFGIQLKESSGN